MSKKRKQDDVEGGLTNSQPNKRTKTTNSPLISLSMGIDGGGTHTTCAIIQKSANNKVLSTSCSGCTNMNSVGHDKSIENLEDCIVKSLQNLPLDIINYRIDSIGLAMSSVDREEDITLITSWIRKIVDKHDELSGYTKICVNNDASGALCSGTKGGVLRGIVLISGTGCICYGYLDNKTSFRSAGWGPLFLDKGSGYWIGQQVLVKIVEDYDGMLANHTKLTQYVLSKLGLEKVTDLIPFVYGNLEWQRIASLAKYAFDLYNEDSVAKLIIDKSVDYLYEYVKVIALKMIQICDSDRAKNVKFQLVLSGSILTHENSVMKKLLVEKVYGDSVLQNIIETINLPKVKPAVGAAFMCDSY